MRNHNASGDTESKSGPALGTATGLVHPIKAIEHMRHMLGRNANAGVAYRYNGFRAIAAYLDLHLPTLGRVLDAVIQKIEEHLAESSRISPNCGSTAVGVVSRNIQAQLKTLRIRQGLHGFGHAANKGLQVHGLLSLTIP